MTDWVLAPLIDWGLHVNRAAPADLPVWPTMTTPSP
jgi:hypothetical protein